MSWIKIGAPLACAAAKDPRLCKIEYGRDALDDDNDQDGHYRMLYTPPHNLRNGRGQARTYVFPPGFFSCKACHAITGPDGDGGDTLCEPCARDACP